MSDAIGKTKQIEEHSKALREFLQSREEEDSKLLNFMSSRIVVGTEFYSAGSLVDHTITYIKHLEEELGYD